MGRAVEAPHTMGSQEYSFFRFCKSRFIGSIFQRCHPFVQDTGIGKLEEELPQRQVKEIEYICKKAC
jgi:hypothetical protein